jgi:hypothetical protein
MIKIAPRGWHPGQIEKRFANTAPISFNRERRAVDAVLSLGSPVRRFYGTEVLRIEPSAVDVSRVLSGGCPLLDSHQTSSISNALGTVQRVWFPGDGSLMGQLRFNKTPQGEAAMGMVARGEIAGISVGYRVDAWEATDASGAVVDDPGWNDDDLVFTATRWQILESSLVSVGADAGATVRSLGGGNSEISDIKARMLARQRMHDRSQARGLN